jgi:hypothetical protein
LPVEDGPFRARHVTGRRGVQADATVRIKRRREQPRQTLQQQERGFVADPAAGLASLGQDPVRAGLVCGHRLVDAHRFDQHFQVEPLQRGDHPLEIRR